MDTHVLGFLAAPDRQMSLRAVSLALLKVRAIDGMTCAKLGEALACSVDTIRAASNEETLLSFDGIARLLYTFSPNSPSRSANCGSAPSSRPPLPSGLSASSATWTPSEKRLRDERDRTRGPVCTAPHAG